MERWTTNGKIIAAAVLVCLVLYPLTFVQTASATTLTIASELAEAEGFAPVFTQGGFAVPVELARAFGAEVKLEGDRYAITYRGTTVWVHPADGRAVTASGERQLRPEPFFAADTLFVPLNFLADVLRLRVSWNPAMSTITLSPWTSALSVFTSEPAGREHAQGGVAPVPVLPPAPVPQPTALFEGLVARLTVEGEEAFAAPARGMWPELYRVTGISVERTVDAGLVTYEFEADGELSVSTALLVEPFRLVADIGGAGGHGPIAADPLPIGDGTVRQIRASRTEDGVRLVFDMDEPVGHRVVALDGGRVGIQFFRPFRGVSIEAGKNGGKIVLDVPGSPRYAITRLPTPDRVVIDLYDTTLVGGPVTLEPRGGMVTRVRAAQFVPDVARVVLDVAGPLEIEPEAGAGGLAFVYGDMLGQIAYRMAGTAGIDLRLNVDADAEIRLSRLAAPDRLVIDVRPMRLEAQLAEVMIPSGPVYRLRASQHDADTVRIVADLKFYVQHAIQRDGRRAVIALRQPDLAGRTISVDPGHGGIDVGAISAVYGLTEKDVNLDIALRLRDLIADAEGGVHMTRVEDVRIGSNQRDGLMERVFEASRSDSDVFVSIHNNSVLTPSPTAKGTETFYRSNDPKSRELAQAIQASVVSALGTVDRGIIDNSARGYFVLRYIEKPAVLVEIAFLTDPEEEELLAQPWFRQRAAEGIFNGLLKYFHPDDSVDESRVVWPEGGSWLRVPSR